MALSKISTLLESFDDKVTVNCELHGDFQMPRSYAEKFGPKEFCPSCSDKRDAERLAESQREWHALRAEVDRRELVKNGISARFIDKTLETYRCDTPAKTRAHAACQTTVDAIKSNATAPSLILCGKPGTGKSHLGCGMVIAIGGGRASKINVIDLIREVRSTWARDSERSEKSVLDYYGSRALLVIDEIGIQNGTDNEKVIMFDILNRRYEACLPTVLISNLSPDLIKAELGERVMDRLREDGGRMIAFDWESERRGAA